MLLRHIATTDPNKPNSVPISIHVQRWHVVFALRTNIANLCTQSACEHLPHSNMQVRSAFVGPSPILRLPQRRCTVSPRRRSLRMYATQPDTSIVVGSVALAAPFFLALALFSERIVRQRRCEPCSGSGLVKNRAGRLKRCNKCGGFLPWISWKRFFTG